MTSPAVVLVCPSEIEDGERVARLLRFFGVEPERSTVASFVDVAAPGAHVLCTATAFTELSAAIDRDAQVARAWADNVASAFVFSTTDGTSPAHAVATLTGAPAVALTEVSAGALWSVTAELPEVCRSLSGLKLTVDQDGLGLVLDRTSSYEPIIATAHASAFGRCSLGSVPVYLSTGGVIDIGAPLPGRSFDIRRHFLDAAPIVLYVRAAFGARVWTTAETRACLVIDDPLLKARYGLVNFVDLVGAMQRADFATSIAFIPWNWRRSVLSTVRLFRENPDRLSLSIHGSDHTASEFGSLDSDRLAWKASQAAERMARHEARTEIVHDRVMVFPQGVFSATAMAVLKRRSFIGVVNTEVLSEEPIDPPITVADYWGVAVMRYSDFPIYTRRYPAAGVENFAFDILLGKPCIVVVHHYDCRDSFSDVVALIERLNALNAELRWSSLGQLIRHSYSERVVAEESEVKLFAPVATLQNTSARSLTLHCVKQESEPGAIAAIRAGEATVDFVRGDGRIEFDVTLAPSARTDVAIAFRPPDAVSSPADVDLRYKTKVLVRRQLCELRDNYLAGYRGALPRTRWRRGSGDDGGFSTPR